jgi:DNA-binding phage protein
LPRRFDVETRPFDPATYLDSEEAIAAYLADARMDGDKALADAAEVVARARRASVDTAATGSAAGVAEAAPETFGRD